jgi:peptidyl-prolyl cis-trans isomerase B (cyclophilin B)
MLNIIQQAKKMKKLCVLLVAFLLPIIGSAQEVAEKDPNELYAVIETNSGTLEFLLYRQVAPVTVSSFVNLATRGFYDGLTFHRVINDFMAQGGDPKGNGSGGPGYNFEDEIRLRHNQMGILAMANAGPDTNGSQFFIAHQATPHLNGLHTVFGLIHSGRELIREIRIGDTINSITIVGDAKALLERNADRVYGWNQSLDLLFPDLRPALID